MSRDINLPSVVSVLPKNQQQWINDFMINDLKRAKISDPAPSPGSNVRGFCGRTLAGAMMASEARRKGDMRTFAQVDSLLRRSDPDAASSMIETGLMEIKAFSAATDVAHDAGLGNVSKAVDYAVVKAVSENNPSVRRAMSEAGSMPRLDPMLIQALIDMHKGLPGYFPEYYRRRTNAGIAIRAIIPKTKIGMERRTHDKEEAREIAFVPSDKYYFSPEINIYDNKVMIASWREKLGIIIESNEIADAMKKIYELAWAEAKRLDKEI